MPIERSKRRVASDRITATLRRLLDASTLCAIATVSPNGRAHVNTAYFAWSRDFNLVWLSEPQARHSRNIRAHASIAIAVYEPNQTWGAPDRGVQLFGYARELDPRGAREAEDVYVSRFARYDETDLGAYRFYRLRPQRIKLFDEPEFGTGVFVTARLMRSSRLVWERTEIYRSST